MIGLCDCNSFYASCERLFRPDLYHSPIAVLSNNDGVVVALNTEAKKLGFARGDIYVLESYENGTILFHWHSTEPRDAWI